MKTRRVGFLSQEYFSNTLDRPPITDKMDSPFIKNASFHVFPYVAYLLKYSDILITDYSGIIYDFLYLNRPMIALANDWRQYDQIRGFNLDFPKIFPGEIVNDFKGLLRNMEIYLTNPQKDSKTRESWFRLFRDFNDAKNAHRTYALINYLL